VGYNASSAYVAGIDILCCRDKFFFDKARTGEAEDRVRRSSLVISATCAASAEALLADGSSNGLAV
jgi:hypothetical protein